MCVLVKAFLAAIACAAVVAHADTIRTFDLSGSSVFYGLAGDTNTVSGTITIDTTTGMVQAISVVAGGSSQSGVDGQTGLMVYFGAAPAKISFDAGTLVDYMGSTFDLNGPNDLYVGHITPAVSAVTPEPASLILCCTGLAAVGGVARRRTLYRGA